MCGSDFWSGVGLGGPRTRWGYRHEKAGDLYSFGHGPSWGRGTAGIRSNNWWCSMSKETPKDDPRERTDQGSHRQTEEPWKGNPEKEQRSGTKKSDPDKWQETNTH
jgi:hypothetical protein